LPETAIFPIFVDPIMGRAYGLDTSSVGVISAATDAASVETSQENNRSRSGIGPAVARRFVARRRWESGA